MTQAHLTILEEKIVSLEDTVKRLERFVLSIGSNKQSTTWMLEAEAKAYLNLSTTTLRRLRQDGIIKFSTASGRKIKYFRKDVERYQAGKIAYKASARKSSAS